MKTKTKTKKLKFVSSLAPREHLLAMVDALVATGDFTVVRDNEAGTVTITHTARGVEVFRALEKEAGGAWIVSSAEGLLSLA